MKNCFTFLNFAITLFFSIVSYSQKTDFVYGDALPDAPSLSARGEYKVGVKTLEFTNSNQIDILKSKGEQTAFYDRKLKIEVWYPATLVSDQKELVVYDEVMGSSNDPKRPIIPFTFQGRAARDAKPLTTEGKFPLVIVSHGYLGSRLLLTYLTENLASKGYIVVAIDHMESTFRDAAGFPSTLLNRSKDIIFVLNQMAALNQSKDALKGLIDVDQTGLIGYSMGGYGVLNVAGAGYSDNSLKLFGALTGGSKALESRLGSNAEYKTSIDARIKAVVAFAPWGMERGVWDAESLKGLKIPTFFFAGSQDDISGYEKGIKAIYNGAINTDRYMLTYMNARHNVAPNPPPAESLQPGLHIDEYYRYAEPAWNEKRINNINQHFVTAFLGIHLKQKDFGKYLNLPQDSNAKTWEGFKPRSSVGLELLHALPEGK
ncbi:alpha/beta hydrolase family protein [Lacihabitans soyangensis]|uniref:Dienelactone hydrolase n=1 Tax=Lacihabitans soyangensis TaxID=869394 RepID=A0AAE3KQT7_9BACT|nr:dienelactone hydrolase [Lacihabitans soyangensis]MCP9761467.1 dienelactone hydrolase [Lacihabitans soyangensis]